MLSSPASTPVGFVASMRRRGAPDEPIASAAVSVRSAGPGDFDGMDGPTTRHVTVGLTDEQAFGSGLRSRDTGLSIVLSTTDLVELDADGLGAVTTDESEDIL